MHLFMYVCMHACIGVCMYVYMYVCMYVYMHVCVFACMHVCICVCVCIVCVYFIVRHACIYVLMYVGVDYTYIDVNALAQGIKSFLASQVWFQAVAGARTYGTDSPAITSQPR